MIECPSCHTQHPNGTLFCSKCGVLLSSASMHTKPLSEIDKPVPSGEPRTPGGETTEAEERQAMNILIRSSGRQVLLSEDKEYIIGRPDATRDIFPDLDLTPDGGLDGGVSRRHTRVYRQRKQFFIEDLGSANGTFLNGQRLTPYLPYPLRNEDEVQVGLVRLKIQINPD